MSLLLVWAGAGGSSPPVAPTPIYEVAFGYTWQSTAPVWTDVTPYVDDTTDTTVTRGRSSELDTFQTGTARFTLKNDGRRFDPSHAAGPYFGQLLPNVPVRIRLTFLGTTYDIFRGFIDGWPQAYTIGNRIARVDISCSDAFKLFAKLDLVSGFFTFDSSTLGVLDNNRLGGGIETAELSGARINTVLDLAGWPSSLRDISTGATLCQAQSSSGSAMDALRVVEQSEDGFLYIETDGDVTFVGRHERQTTTRLNTAQATFDDADGDYPYRDLRYQFDDQRIYNDVRRQREGGLEKTAENDVSIGKYFRSTHSLTGLVMASDSIAQDIADVNLERYREPRQRIEQLVIDSGNNRINLYVEVLARRILDRITVRRTPQEVGSVIDQDLLIQGMTHTFNQFRWSATYYVTPVDTFQMFVFDSATLGVLDEDLIGA